MPCGWQALAANCNQADLVGQRRQRIEIGGVGNAVDQIVEGQQIVEVDVGKARRLAFQRDDVSAAVARRGETEGRGGRDDLIGIAVGVGFGIVIERSPCRHRRYRRR